MIEPTSRRSRGALQALLVLAILTIAAALLPSWRAQEPAAAADIRISNAQFARYIEEWSEPEGYFDSDNFISNETSYLHPIGALQERVRPGGVYIGVGPDQNFSYIATTQPSLAVIVDIRRQNMLQQLWYKALFELANSRAEFLSLWLSRKPLQVGRNADLRTLLRATRTAAPDPAAFPRNLDAVKQLLTKQHGLKLDAMDLAKIEYVYDTFRTEGLDLRFSTIGRASATRYPTLEELLLETDRGGQWRNYLATEELYQRMRQIEVENRLIPIVGDFGGTQAFKSVAGYLSTNGLSVSTFYTSNVEFYLFGTPAWDGYLKNVRGLPALPGAVFIRAYFGTSGPVHPENVPGHRPTSLVQSYAEFLNAARQGKIQSYWDIVKPN